MEGVPVSLAMCCYSDKVQTDSLLEANNSLRKCTVKHVFRLKKINKYIQYVLKSWIKKSLNIQPWFELQNAHSPCKISYALMKSLMSRLKLFLFFVSGKMMLNNFSPLFAARFFFSCFGKLTSLPREHGIKQFMKQRIFFAAVLSRVHL